MASKSWDELTNDEKLDRLTSVLTLVGSDTTFRERCLRSVESAKAAVSEVAGIEFPPDFRVQFVTPQEQLKSLVLTLPEFRPEEDGVPEVRNAEDFEICSYQHWRA
jgi:hypothetical protein